jgi:predicted esterase
MKTIHFVRLTILFFYTISCAGKNHGNTSGDNNDIDTTIANTISVTETFENGKVIPHVICKAAAEQSYALYIPAKGNKEPLPVIYFFDPHGDGSLPLDRYRSLAESYNFILIGSNNSKNGNDGPTSESIWNTLSGDSQKRLKINTNRIYLCGFSGGAKVAMYAGLNHHEIKGVIANGAGIPDVAGSANVHFTFTAIAGRGDMNMTDLVSITNDLDKTQIRHRLIYFDGIHEWAPENTMNIAFAGLQLDAMLEKLIPIDNTFIDNYIDSSKKRIDGYSNTNDYIKAQDECKLSISMLNGLTGNVKWFSEKDASIKSNPVYKKQSESAQNLFATEQNIKNVFTQEFQQGDMNYWLKTIKDVQTKAKAKTDEGAMFQRLQAFLSLAFYSISNQMISGNKNSDAAYFVDLYKLADPTNSEAWYFSAILNARNNNVKGTEDDLLKSVANGFSDKTRLMQQIEFQQLGTQINLAQIESKMK